MLTSSNFMRQQAMQSKMLYGRPIPVGRAVQGIADRAAAQHLTTRRHTESKEADEYTSTSHNARL